MTFGKTVDALIVGALLLVVAGVAQAQTVRSTVCNTATLPNEVCLTWGAVITRVDGLPTNFPITYRVEQQAGTGAFATIQTVSTLRAYIKNLAAGDYVWRVYAVENAKESDPSNTAGKSIVQAAPVAPVIIIAATIHDDGPPTFRIVYTVTPRAGEVVFVAPESLRKLFAAK